MSTADAAQATYGLRERLSGDQALLVLAALLVLFLVGYPVVISVRTIELEAILALFTSDQFLPIQNSLLAAVLTIPPSVAIAVPMAFLCVRTNMPGRGIVGVLVATSFVIPMLLTSIAYVFLLGKNAGFINVFFRPILGGPLYNIYSFSGVVFIAVLHSYPLIFFTTASGLSKMNPELEESARVCGMSPFQVFRRITVGAILPSVMAGVLFALAFALTMLSGPLILGTAVGIPFVTTEMYAAIVMNPSPVRAVALSLPLLVMTLAALWVQGRIIGRSAERYAVVAGKGQRSDVVDLGAWRIPALILCFAPIVLSLILPLLTLLGAGLMEFWWKGFVLENMHLGHFVALLTDPITLGSIWNSVILSTSVGLVLAFAGAGLAIVLAGPQGAVKRFIRGVATVPLGIPHVVAGVLVILAWYGIPFHLGGTIWILAFAYILVMMPYALKTCEAARGQIDSSLGEAARLSGCTPLESWRYVLMPLMRNGVFTTFVIVFLFVIKEFPVTALVYSANTLTLAVRVFNFYEGGSFEKTGAAAVILMVLTLAAVVIAAKIFKVPISNTSE